MLRNVVYIRFPVILERVLVPDLSTKKTYYLSKIQFLVLDEDSLLYDEEA